jgi:hypothetical protein
MMLYTIDYLGPKYSKRGVEDGGFIWLPDTRMFCLELRYFDCETETFPTRILAIQTTPNRLRAQVEWIWHESERWRDEREWASSTLEILPKRVVLDERSKDWQIRASHKTVSSEAAPA